MDMKVKRGQILKELRLNKKLSQQNLADVLKVSARAYQKYEYGTAEPTFDTLSQLADFYEVTTDYLLGREPLPDPFADLELSKDIEDDVMAKFTSLSPEVRAIVIDVIAKLGDIIRERQSEAKPERITITAGELEDQWKSEQEAKNKDVG